MINQSRLLPLLALANLALASSGKAIAAEYPHDKPGGGSVKGHWAHLEGHYGDNDKRRAMLVNEIQECVAAYQKAGMPTKAPKADEIPELVHSLKIDLYQTPNRFAKFHKSKIYDYNRMDCSLTEMASEKITIMSAKGVCNIDMKRKFAAGVCDKSVHAGAPKFVHVNNNMIAADPKLRNLMPAVTGVKKSIAGLQCDVYETTIPVNGSFCTSKAGSFLAAGVLSLQGGIPGLHLEMRTTDRETLVATEARLDMAISDAVFEVPAGVTIRTVPGGMK